MRPGPSLRPGLVGEPPDLEAVGTASLVVARPQHRHGGRGNVRPVLAALYGGQECESPSFKDNYREVGVARLETSNWLGRPASSMERVASLHPTTGPRVLCCS